MKFKRCFLLGRKAMTNQDSILKSRDSTSPTKVHLVKAMVFPVVMYGCESWTVKEAEYRRIDAFKLWCWRRLLRVPWTARRSNLSILKEISPEYSLESDAAAETPILWLPETKNWFIGKTLMLGKIEGRRRRGRQDEMVWMVSPTGWIWVWAGSGVGDGQRSLPCFEMSMGSQRVRHDWATELMVNFCFNILRDWRRKWQPTPVFLPGESHGV